MNYVDGFVVPVPSKNLAAYKRMSTTMGKVWSEHGALQYRECVADDVKPGAATAASGAIALETRGDRASLAPARLPRWLWLLAAACVLLVAGWRAASKKSQALAEETKRAPGR